MSLSEEYLKSFGDINEEQEKRIKASFNYKIQELKDFLIVLFNQILKSFKLKE